MRNESETHPEDTSKEELLAMAKEVSKRVENIIEKLEAIEKTQKQMPRLINAKYQQRWQLFGVCMITAVFIGLFSYFIST